MPKLQVSILLWLTALLTFNANAQYSFPVGIFLKDSIKIGESVKYSFTYRHSPELELLFPDSTYNFYPFELVRKTYHPTVSDSSSSLDSVIYELRTFETDKLLPLGLPVYILEGKDTILQYAVPDTLFLSESITTVPSSLEFKDQSLFQPLEIRLNYPYALVISLGVLLLGLIIYTVFGKSVERRYRLYTIRKSHLNFLKSYEKLQKDFKKNPEVNTIEQALSLWKGYLSKLENKPIYTYTTTEIISLYEVEDLKNVLQIIDRAIYGGLISSEAEKAMARLKKFSNKRFQKRKNAIRKNA
ncbi:MAG TPA: hypothetical protein VIK89_00415 [Cytophagaceae bacterium]